MSIVKFAGGTSTPEGNDDLAARDERFRDLEHEVCNLERAGKIVEHFVAGWLNVGDNPLPRDAELAVYAVATLQTPDGIQGGLLSRLGTGSGR